jgi:hypothetical protein
LVQTDSIHGERLLTPQSHNGGDGAPREEFDPLDETHKSDNTHARDDLVATAATVCVVGAGVLIFEAALLPGMLLGVAAMLAPKALPKIGAAMDPLLKLTVRSAYVMGQKAQEALAETQERVHDIVAEVEAEAKKMGTRASSDPGA